MQNRSKMVSAYLENQGGNVVPEGVVLVNLDHLDCVLMPIPLLH